jgi:hypothetical protein
MEERWACEWLYRSLSAVLPRSPFESASLAALSSPCGYFHFLLSINTTAHNPAPSSALLLATSQAPDPIASLCT